MYTIMYDCVYVYVCVCVLQPQDVKRRGRRRKEDKMDENVSPEKNQM